MSKKRFKILDELLKEEFIKQGMTNDDGTIYGYEVDGYVVGDTIEADEYGFTPEFWADKKLFEVIGNE